jgi:hypothetical protein
MFEESFPGHENVLPIKAVMKQIFHHATTLKDSFFHKSRRIFIARLFFDVTLSLVSVGSVIEVRINGVNYRAIGKINAREVKK